MPGYKSDQFSTDILGYLAIAAVCIGAELLLNRNGVKDYTITNTVMWVLFFAFWDWRRGETLGVALMSGCGRYFAYFTPAILAVIAFAGHLLWLGGDAMMGLAIIVAIIAYTSTLALIYSWRNKS